MVTVPTVTALDCLREAMFHSIASAVAGTDDCVVPALEVVYAPWAA